MWLNISERTFYVLLWETPLYTFYSLERLKEEGAQYSGATVYNSWVQHVTLQRGRFVHRAVIWCVNMASINPEGARVIKSCIVVLQGRILPLTLVWLDINMAFRRESPSFQKKKKKTWPNGAAPAAKWRRSHGWERCSHRHVWSARKDQCVVPGLRVCRGRQMYPLHSDALPRQLCEISLSRFPEFGSFLLSQRGFSRFVFITLIHSLT